MSSHTSTKDLAKAITAFISSPSLPLPDDLSNTIEGYLEKHENYDQASAEKLQEELMSIYNKYVVDNPPRFAPFLAVLRQVRPAIRASTHILQWFDKMVEPVLGYLGQEKRLAMEALTNIESLLIADGDDQETEEITTTPNPVVERLFEKWMALARLAQDDSPDSAFNERFAREAALRCGKKRPRSFFLAINHSFKRKEFRSRTLALLCEFVQTQPAHLYVVLKTPFFENLLRCLQSDTSTTVVSLGLSALIMLLPNMPSSLVPHLPALFNIYARLLFWDRERAIALDDAQAPPKQEEADSGAGWETCDYSSDVDGTHIQYLLGYFTILYGLYPLNLIEYIRKPQRYLRHANAPGADDIEVQPSEIRHRSERYRQWHLLHPNFYSMTIDSEKTDFSRWIKSEPADVVAECMALCLPLESGAMNHLGSITLRRSPSPLASDDAEKDGSDHALLSGSLMMQSAQGFDVQHAGSAAGGSAPSSRAQSTIARQSSVSSHPSMLEAVEGRAKEAGADSPTLPPHLVLSTSQTDLQDMINSNKAIKSAGLQQHLPNDSVPSLSLSHHENVPETPSVRLSGPGQSLNNRTVSTDGTDLVAELRREILLLKNDLNFERYLKQQHIAHNGTLRRKQVKEAATEAETQNLLMTNRNLKHRLEESKRAELQTKKESEKGRTLAKKWESDLSNKLRNLREEQKKWNSEGASLRRDLEAAREECEKLRKLVGEAEVKQLNSAQTMQSIEINSGEIERLRAEVQRLAASERENQGRENAREAAMRDAAQMETGVEALRMQLQARETELTRTRNLYEGQIEELNVKLADALETRSNRTTASKEAAKIFESALAASRAKQSDLQKQYSLLMRKYTVLQSSLLDMTCNTAPTRSRTDAAASSDADAEVSAIVGSPLRSVTSRTQRIMSEPDSFEPASLSALSPLESYGSGGSAGTAIQRPMSPSGGAGRPADAAGVSSVSPTNERYHGRGGVQNTIRKDRKDKKKDEGDKKERKPSESRDIRGLRGFVMRQG